MSSPKTTSPDPPTLPNPTLVKTTSKAHSALQSLYLLLGDPLPPSLSSSETPPLSLLHNTEVAQKITSLLRQPLSGAGDDNICRWLYDTFQSSNQDLQLTVLRFLPTLSGVYLIRAVARKPLAGFEAVLLALYAHVTMSRSAHPLTVTIPDISNPSLYHESSIQTKSLSKNSATELTVAVVSPSLEPHGTVRSTRRARIVGVALELYYTKISLMPVQSKIEFCEFCEVWAGQDGDMFKGCESSTTLSGPDCIEDDINGGDEISNEDDGTTSNVMRSKSVKEECGENGGRIPLPWELLQPCLRILGHCLLGPTRSKELKKAAWATVRSLYARALHDVDPQAILATGSLLKLGKMEIDSMTEPLDDQKASSSFGQNENLVVFSA
ncbi:uncharacterized protein LOC131250567 [Magnolia sinica]|uniref:uncharacterized protein LOC131250567 n=1 Tax=Magnolia sinica TaxID=86752 RepID=UPI00265A74F5|nr:uncharacterized protein LOC131250567 [Magnolia sinica]